MDVKTGILGALLCVAFIIAGCAGEPAAPAEPNVSPAPNPYLNTLESKLSAWQQLTAERGDSYRYVVSSAAFVGPSYNTTLTLQGGRVVRRDLTTFEVDDAGNSTVKQLWAETGSAVGSHDEGAEPTTLDARFAACRETLSLADLETDDIDLEFIVPGAAGRAPEGDGPVLSVCFVLAKNVAYDGGAEVVAELEFLTN